METSAKIKAAVDFIRLQTDIQPQAAVILGSGLGSYLTVVENPSAIPYEAIPHFPVSTVEGHQGKMVFGTVAGKSVVVMAGRFHYYEGYTPEEVIFPIRVLHQLGIQILMLSNAAGGMRADFKIGDIMIINDQISLFVPNPLIGKNPAELGPRFPDMSEPYQKTWIAKAKHIAEQAQMEVKEGVYCAVTGPTFETKAEYTLLRRLGADAVGMSTVMEVIAAAHMQLPVFGVSVITDLGTEAHHEPISHAEVLEAAAAAEPKLTHLFVELIREM